MKELSTVTEMGGEMEVGTYLSEGQAKSRWGSAFKLRHKGFGIGNKAEVDFFLGLSCFFDHPTDAGNLISGSLL